ncbi:hypothetical protein CFIO01_11670 [Colletotrichum fioriniae PJ7]|uniref:Uncharacterized protein n=1 Tax=Colletotrichum fioriniae PJ7 TaxID=1445577 RepID=A0A010RZ81_9PEZI|nr:hypothetical protein CFIO01_11670 [Colletotrichum fioriniae PJ7]
MTTIKIGLGRDKIPAPGFIDMFRHAEKGGRNLDHRHVDLMTAELRTKKITGYIRRSVKVFVRRRDAVTDFLKEALDLAIKAGKIVLEFDKEHPNLVAIVAGGVMLASVSPWVLQALGFGQLGLVAGKFFRKLLLRPLYLKINSDAVPTQGSFAARWQAPIGAAVPTGSLFSILRWLRMTWIRVLGRHFGYKLRPL